jgi:RHS repeat-associated protein
MHSVSLKFLVGILSFSDYYPFGMQMVGRNDPGDGYRYGFQRQESDPEITGSKLHIAFTYRCHDVRLGRFWSIDPLAAKYPYNSPYAFSENRLIDGIELEGLEFYKEPSGVNNTDFRWIGEGTAEAYQGQIDDGVDLPFTVHYNTRFPSRTKQYYLQKKVTAENIADGSIDGTDGSDGGDVDNFQWVDVGDSDFTPGNGRQGALVRHGIDWDNIDDSSERLKISLDPGVEANSITISNTSGEVVYETPLIEGAEQNFYYVLPEGQRAKDLTIDVGSRPGNSATDVYLITVQGQKEQNDE